MAYLLLTIAIAFELIGTTLLKYTNGFTVLMPSVVCIASYILCFYALARSVQSLNLGIAYATWSAVGLVVTTMISVMVFKEHLTPTGIGGVILIVIGVVVLNLFGTQA